MPATGCRVSLRMVVLTAFVTLLLVAGMAATSLRASAQERDPASFTVASGTVAIGPAAPAWYAARLTVQPGEPMPDPAAGVPGFLLVIEGAIAVTDLKSDQLTLLQEGGALFVTPSAAITLTAVDDEATAWRIAVVAADDPAPLGDGDDVSSLLSTTGDADPAASPGDPRPVELRLGALESGETATLGEDGWAVPFVAALTGEGLLDDGSTVAEGRFVSLQDHGTSVEVSADSGPAVIGAVLMGPSLDPGSLAPDTSANSGSGGSGGSMESTPSSGNDQSRQSNSTTQPTEEPTEEPAKTTADTSDNDGDGLSADDESRLGTNPAKPDTDGDGLSDGQEVNDFGTNPMVLDTDGDGVTDGDEASGSFGNISPTNDDSDFDGLSDGDELFLHHTDPTMSDTDVDGDGDGAEVAAGKDPLVLNDRDGDYLGDALEAYYGTNPDNPDSDEDMLTDTYELFTTSTDPNVYDTDGDGTGDAVENASGTDPLDPASHP